MAILTANYKTQKATPLFTFTNGIAEDKYLASNEIKVQSAWARALGRAHYLTETEVSQLLESFAQALLLLKEDKFPWHIEDEDVHMNLERFVTEKLGDLGKKMHLGRSRNDLIATTLRLFCVQCIDEISVKIKVLSNALCTRSSKDIEIIIPGLTHLQNGQPVRYAHTLMSYAVAFHRDLQKLQFAKSICLQTMPLGSAALAGTTLDINLNDIATELGFENPSLNSYDSVGDRDFMISTLEGFSSTALHLSRLSEDIIIWSSSNIALLNLPTSLSTGSSIMPNKRNPDVAELTRGKSAHIINAVANAQLLLKGLPSCYNSDLHELKKVFIHSFQELTKILDIFPHFIQGLEINKEKALELLNKGHLLATEFANELVDQGVPFREAYKQVAQLVDYAQKKTLQIHEIHWQTVQSFAPKISQKFIQKLNFSCAVEMRNNCGGTAREMVLKTIEQLKNND